MISTSMVGANKLVELDDELIEPGKDILVYDLVGERYLALKGDTFDYRKFNFRRYETNFDVILGIFTGNSKKMLHAVACADTSGTDDGWYNSNVAANVSSYLLELDLDNDGLVSFNGSITYSSANSNGSLSNVVLAWQAGESLSNLADELTAKRFSYLTYAICPETEIEVKGGENVISQSAIGINNGGYGSNTWSISKCYRYDPNTSPTFEASVYYRWTGSGYAVIEEEPSDWSENYSSYYTRSTVTVGTTLKAISKANGDNVPLVTRVDLTKLAVLWNEVKYRTPFKLKKNGTTVTPYYPPFNSSFKNYRGTTPQTILGSSRVPVTYTTTNQDLNKFNRNYRAGVNFSITKDYYASSGTTSFASDGNGGSENDSIEIMRKTTFENNVNADAENENAAKMYAYYSNIFNRTSYTFDGVTYDVSDIRDALESWYGEMNDIYDAYVMSHMTSTTPTSGLVYYYRNRGKLITHYKGNLYTLYYNLKYVPAYPPEYNCLCYGNPSKTHFAPGLYSHSEPLDLAVMFRDDMVAKINATYEKISAITDEGIKPSKVVPLDPSASRWCVAEYGTYRTWMYYGSTSGCFSYTNRYNGYPPRPIMTVEL